MPAHITRLQARAESLRRSKTQDLRQLVLELEGESPEMARGILSVIDRHMAAERAWRFTMVDVEQHRLVVDWILDNAARPRISMRLWAGCFCWANHYTGEILASRQQMAEEVGCDVAHVSTALTELLRVGALIRHQKGHSVRWFMSPWIVTSLTGKAREDAQDAAPPLAVSARAPA